MNNIEGLEYVIWKIQNFMIFDAKKLFFMLFYDFQSLLMKFYEIL